MRQRRHSIFELATVLLLQALMIAPAAPARADEPDTPAPFQRSEARAFALSSSELSDEGELRTLHHTGTALTVSGLATFAGGLFWFLLPLLDSRASTGWDNAIGGGTFMGLGGVLVLSAIPVWIVHAVRLDHASNGAGSRRDGWVLAGGIVFAAGLVLALIGAIGLPLSMQAGDPDTGRSIGLLSTMPIGVALASFVGAPMLGEGLRF